MSTNTCKHNGEMLTATVVTFATKDVHENLEFESHSFPQTWSEVVCNHDPQCGIMNELIRSRAHRANHSNVERVMEVESQW